MRNWIRFDAMTEPEGSDLRLADLLGGLSIVADLGFGLPPQEAMRGCIVSTALARRMELGADDVRDCFYVPLLMHVGCIGMAHETAAAFGDELATTGRNTRWFLAPHVG